MSKPDIKRLIEFQRLVLSLQAVERLVHVPGSFRKENDVEHSFSLALTAWYLAEYFVELDRDKVIRLALAHDLVEVHAGDTYIYADAPTIAGKKQREQEALARLQKDWPDFPDIIDTIHEYEARSTAEAKFVYALDKIMPIMVIFMGEGYSWRQLNVALDQIHINKLPKVKLSPEVKPYYDQLYELLRANSQYFPAAKKIK